MSELNGLAGLLNSTLDDVADLPSFECPPSGHYKLAVSLNVKKINNKDAVELACEILETLELVDVNATPPAPGGKFSTAFQIGNADVDKAKTAMSFLKAAVKPIMEALGTTSFGDVLGGQVQGMQVFATVKRRADKDDPEKFYASVSNIVPA